MDGDLERGRSAYARREWQQAFASLTEADAAAPLAADDLERLATTAYMLGRDGDLIVLLERAHHAFLAEERPRPAVRCAFWLGISLFLQREVGQATGWLGRAQRLLEGEGECVEQGWLLLPVALQQAAQGEHQAAYTTCGTARAIGDRYDDADLRSLSLQEQGRSLMRLGSVSEGLALLDEAMVGVTSGEVSPMVTGLIYCSMIEGCHEVWELRRAGEWTAALLRWCDQQPELVAYTGTCLVHRAEILQLRGDWADALEEAQRAGQRFATRMQQTAAGQAFYRQGEIHRLQGRLAAAEEAFQVAGRSGFEPQPGTALLLLAQGKREAAAAAIRRAVAETTEPLLLAPLLPAQAHIGLATGDLALAADAARRLERVREQYDAPMLDAMLCQARGAVRLAEGEPEPALRDLRRACALWQELEVPYEMARTRVLVGRACGALGDADGEARELDAARRTFAELGAVADEAALSGSGRDDAAGLTDRELEVLRLVAAGETNRAIAERLVLSERTVDRHVANIFAKLRVATRAAATGYAYEHGLL